MLSLSSEHRDDYTIIRVSGNLDLVTRDQFDEYLTSARRRNSRIVIDMSDVTFMDTGCLAVIMGHWKKLLTGSGKLILAGPRYRETKALWITGLAYRLPLYDSVEEAIEADKAGAAQPDAKGAAGRAAGAANGAGSPDEVVGPAGLGRAGSVRLTGSGP